MQRFHGFKNLGMGQFGLSAGLASATRITPGDCGLFCSRWQLPHDPERPMRLTILFVTAPDSLRISVASGYTGLNSFSRT